MNSILGKSEILCALEAALPGNTKNDCCDTKHFVVIAMRENVLHPSSSSSHPSRIFNLMATFDTIRKATVSQALPVFGAAE